MICTNQDDGMAINWNFTDHLSFPALQHIEPVYEANFQNVVTYTKPGVQKCRNDLQPNIWGPFY